MPSEPLVTCIMPTTADRAEFEARARQCFDAQTYPNRELLIDRGPGKVGEKRNRLCSQAHGEIICHWDSDDWYHPERIADQVARLIESGAEITGYHTMKFATDDGQIWLYRSHRKYALGVSLCYWKSFWQRRAFLPLQIGEDNKFIEGANLVSVDARDMIIASIHDHNTSAKRDSLGKSSWTRLK